jgi:hypothetical protein
MKVQWNDITDQERLDAKQNNCSPLWQSAILRS